MRLRVVLPRLRRRPAAPPGGRLRRAAILAAWVFGGAAAVGLAFVLSFWLAMKSEMRSTEVDVPDLDGKTLEEATTATAPLGLQVQVVDRRNDPRVASGRILQQDPGPKASVRRGRKIKVVLSLGGRVLEIPSVVGRGARAVELELSRDGFAAGDEAWVHDASAPSGTVIAQVPPPGSPAVSSTRVHRLVSEGARTATYVMPDLTGLSRTAAERWIGLCGLRPGPVRRVPATGRARGAVVGQLPLAGYPVRSKEIVELTVAE